MLLISLRFQVVIAALISTILLPITARSQAVLEEIIVTAQRREQSLQEVPISIETLTGDEIREQNFRNMEDMAAFSPSVAIYSGVQDQATTIRGVGTIGNSLTLEQAVPIFVDGIHYGRQSQIKTAFLDVDRVEILKGPQPVYFGQNASAGAFNIHSKNPTPEWEGEVDLTYGNNATQELSFGAGGPISDTLGIRVAGAREVSDGFLENAVTGEKLPKYDYFGGRVTLQWSPTDDFQATTKLEGSRLRNGSEAVIGCLDGGSLLFGRRGVDDDNGIGNALGQGNERSIWAEPPVGVGFYAPLPDLPTDCFEGNIALSNEGPYLLAPDTIYEENSSDGSVNSITVAEQFSSTQNDEPYNGLGFDNGGLKGRDFTNAWTGVLNLNYTLDNGIELNSTTGYNNYWRSANKDNCQCPFFMNFQGREENFTQWSSELRLTSPTGGMIEWMGAVSWQTNYKDNFSNSLRPNVRRAQRFNILWEDVTLMNAFATVTFNFLDNRASLDLGGRYSDIDKEVFITGYASTWVFDVEPEPGSEPGYVAVDPDTVRFLQPGADADNLWTYPWKETRDTPQNWYPSTGVEAVGLTFADFPTRLADELDAGVPNHDEFKDSFIDPQVTLRYRMSDNHSVFARWARATKGAGYDTGQTSIPANIDEMRFETEKGETFEIGSKGTFWDGRARYDVTAFRTTFTDLQLSGLAPITDQDSTSISINAGEQRVQGLEFSVTAAVTDQLRLNLNGAVMDGKMTDFNGSGCNTEEFYNTLLDLNIPGVLPCDIDNGELTDRTGTQSPRTPDWKFVLTATYTVPVWDDYEVVFNGKGYLSDGYITARDSFSSVVKYNQHGDLNLSLGLGDQEGVWKLSAYANNIFEARESYNNELDAVPSGLSTLQVPRSSFMTYGLKFGYNFQ